MKRYALCDSILLEKNGSSLDDFVKRCKKLNVDIIQYRNKEGSFRAKRNSLIELRSLWSRTLIINDEIALANECDGVHLGQEDIFSIHPNIEEAAAAVRSKISDKLFGLSTHNIQEIEIANTLPLDYIGLGAYRSTQTKDVSTVLGDKLDALALQSSHPVAAIGGVKFSDAFENITYLVVGSGIYEN